MPFLWFMVTLLLSSFQARYLLQGYQFWGDKNILNIIFEMIFDFFHETICKVSWFVVTLASSSFQASRWELQFCKQTGKLSCFLFTPIQGSQTFAYKLFLFLDKNNGFAHLFNDFFLKNGAVCHFQGLR